MKKKSKLKTIDTNIFIHCPTKKDWISVCKKLEKESCIKWGNTNIKPTTKNYWDIFKKNTFLHLNENELGFGNMKEFLISRNIENTLSTKQFLKGNLVNQQITIFSYR